MSIIKSEDGFPIVGWLVSWSAHKFAIKRDEMIAHLKAVGISDKYAVPVIARNAYIRTARQFGAVGRVEKDSELAYVVGELKVDSNYNPDLDTRGVPVFDKDTKDVKNTKGLPGFEKEMERNKEVYSSDQFRTMVLRYIKRECAAVTYLETGNLYFINVSKVDELKKLQALFARLNGPRLSMKEEIATKQIKSTMWQLAVTEVKDELEKFEADFSQLPKEIAEKTLDTRLKRYNDLKAKAEMFTVVLEGNADDVKTRLAKLTAAIQKKVIE